MNNKINIIWSETSTDIPWFLVQEGVGQPETLIAGDYLALRLRDQRP